jgi:mannose-1-phosphate guanylyltransferase
LNEVNILGTAGGLYHFKTKILEGNPANIFVLHADICCAFPLNDLLAFHKGHGQVCTIMGTKVFTKIEKDGGEELNNKFL